MKSRFEEAIALIDSLPLDEQEKLIEIESKKIIDRKKKSLSEDIKEAKEDIEKGDYVTGDYKEIMKAIDDEVKSNKKI